MYKSGTYLLDPHFILNKAHLRSGMKIADFGCGRLGHFTIPAAQIVGQSGSVYAVDILKDVLHNISSIKMEYNLHNIHPVWSDLEDFGGIKLPEKSLDAVLIVNTLCHSQKKANILNEAKRLAKDKSRLIVVDWHRLPNGLNLDKDMLIDFNNLLGWAFANNFVVQEKFIAGPHHKAIIFFKHD